MPPSRPSPRSTPYPFASRMVAPTDLLWALVGLVLTIGGTFLQAFVINPPWAWGQDGLQPHGLGVSFQIGAVFLTACLGGRNAATISQIAYLLLGLSWFNIFTQGGGIDYVHQPSFGYLLGFIPGAWICGYWAFRLPVRLESLAFSCMCGLLTVHLVGVSYLAIASHWRWLVNPDAPLFQLIFAYSISPLLGQLVVACAVTVVSFLLRHLMFY